MENVDPRYIQYPFWRLILEFGYEWINEQEKLFNKHIDTFDAEAGECNILI